MPRKVGESWSKRQVFDDALDEMPQEFKLDELYELLPDRGRLSFSINEVIGHLNVRVRRGDLKRVKVGHYAKTQT